MQQEHASAGGWEPLRQPERPLRLRVDDLLIEPGTRRVSRNGAELVLPHLSLELLLALVEQAPNLVSIEQLMERVWPRLVVGPETVVQRVKLLRQALGDDSRKPRYIEGIRGRGYRLVAPAVAEPTDDLPAAEHHIHPRTNTGNSQASHPSRYAGRIAAGVIALLLLFIAILLLPRWYREDAPAATYTPLPRLAVLPFENLGPGTGNAWLASGIGDELGTLLSRVEDLLVIRPYSTELLRRLDPQAVREALGADYILSGSLRADETSFRLTVALTRAASGEQLWAHTYTRPLDDILLVQEEVATAVSTALQVRLATGVFALMPGMTRNVDAYTEYLKAATLPIDELIMTPRRALQHLERALVLDPEFSLASTSIYSFYSNAAPYLAPPDAFPEREARMAEALAHWRRVDPEDPYLVLIASMEAALSGRWLEADQDITLFLEAARQRFGSPSHPYYSNLAGIEGQFTRDTGRLRESIPLLERAISVEPLNSLAHAMLAEAFASTGDLARALDANAAALKLPGLQDDALLQGSRILLLLAAYPPGQLAREELDPLLPLDDGYNINRTMFLMQHDPAQALATLREIVRDSNLPAQQVNTSAAWAAWFGDAELALELLDRVRRLSPYMLGAFVARPVYAEVRRQPGFKQLMTELGLVDYWRATGNWADYCRPQGGTELDFECF